MSPWETPEELAARESATAKVDAAALWAHARLLALLADRPDPQAYDLASLQAVMATWLDEPAPGLASKSDQSTLEVARQSGTGDDRFPMDPPTGLDEDAEWFSVAILRHPSARIGSESSTSSSVGLDLWWTPTPTMQELRAHELWDTGNLLGFDCFGDASVGLLRYPLVAEIFEAFGDTPPAAAVLVCSALDADLRLL